MISKKYLLHGKKTGQPRVDSEKACKVQVQYLWLVTANYPGKRSDCTPVQMGRVFQDLEGNIWQVEKTANVVRWFLQEAEDAVPAVLI
jgi:hypothetical protein